MAFEVARVHGLISSRVGDDGVSNGFRNEGASMEAVYSYPHEWSAPGFIPNPHNTPDIPFNYGRYRNRWEANCFPQESSSPCSTEFESDEEDEFFHGLAQQIAHSTFDEEINTSRPVGFQPRSGYPEGRMSPSNLHNGSWSTGSLLSGSRSSSNDSSRVSSQVSSPSSAPSSGYQDAWETLYAAAGEIVRLKMSEEDVEKSYQSRVGNPTMRAHLPQQTRPAGQTAGRNLPLYARRKDWSSMSNNYAMQNWGIKPEASHAIASRSQPHRAGYHHHQQSCFPDGQRDNSTYNHPGKHVDNKLMQNSRQTAVNGGSGVRVVFLGSSTGRESGTGVFLPRVFDQRKAASARQNENNSNTSPGHGRAVNSHRHAKSPREGVWPTLQQSSNRAGVRQPVVHEPRLPSEWTY
ncbi:uncharacterized protein [Physcomitrium patens]|uniref:Uncharacterized protein n=1 Tax=Physcomitrium patens TaxID=3218 RepID=A9TUK1_PHYPA|nr:uncharacterized protein LOC112277502 [Physcomitrium patens]XP_024365697.1 uncharacterized protein LOC112277502 [Physcomitrium patens]XP_024365698.1 uncharacterized protein LOC112277502 [Physcomitrium patens]PNR27392.1 hypothetical protein PHYPA_029544 [Physcomitrium patens]|eukprot:XP_024365696.1 uncharacterized protein LOC112277502 [Physcomitrella patens]